ncbi:MAG: ABC transporter substrate-binding protein, partial [Chloroflexota bacterium]
PTATAAPQAAATTAPAAATVAPPTVPQPQVASIPRTETLIVSVSDSVNQMDDAVIANPFLIGAQRTGWQFAFEAPYYYNEWWTDQVSAPPGMTGKNGEIPYLATDYQYNDSYDELTIKFRPDVTWSDGQPFTANDAVFTVNMLKDNSPKLNFSFEMKEWVKDIAALDDHTLKITLSSANPRFMFTYFQWYLDHGFPFVPEHIFKGQDPQTFTNFDLAKGWPITTGPWKLIYSSPQQKIWERRDDWWGAKTGFHPLPKMKRVIVLPRFEDSKLAQLLIANQTEATHQLQPADAQAVMAQNPKVIVRTLDKSHPWGWIASWPEYVGFNCSKAPYDDPDIRWAINHAFDRKQIVDIGFQGDGAIAIIPLETNAALKPYYDAVSDILQKYPIDDYDPKKTAQIMQSKGYAKDQGGFWAKGGKRFPLLVVTPAGFFDNYVPIVVAQLRKAGFDAAFKSPSDEATIQQLGTEDAFMNGVQGSVRDPYISMEQFGSWNSLPTGQPAQQPFRWTNATYDKAIKGMAVLPASDSKFMPLYRQAMEQWIPALPQIPLVQDFTIVPVNTTYWTGWPDSKNPYTMPAFWLRGSATLLINTLQPAQG